MNWIIKKCLKHGKLTIDKVKIEGNRWRCIECHRISARVYRDKNRRKLRIYSKKYYRKNKK
jgi:hypothetical protein